jgi:hypothetical protein
MSVPVIILLSVLGGIVAGGGGHAWLTRDKGDDTPGEVSVTVDDAAHEDAETAHALTDTEAVAAAYQHAWNTGEVLDLLAARELACWTHGHDSDGTGSEVPCADISHLTGREIIRAICEEYPEDIDRRECIQHFAMK